MLVVYTIPRKSLSLADNNLNISLLSYDKKLYATWQIKRNTYDNLWAALPMKRPDHPLAYIICAPEAISLDACAQIRIRRASLRFLINIFSWRPNEYKLIGYGHSENSIQAKCPALPRNRF